MTRGRIAVVAIATILVGNLAVATAAQKTALKANEDGEFVVFPGLEWSKKWGHVNIFETGEPKADSGRMEVIRSPAAGKHFYFAKATQADGNLMWSAPVWVTAAEQN